MAEESAERQEAREFAESWAKDFPKARLVQWEKDVQKLARAYLDLEEALRLSEQWADAETLTGVPHGRLLVIARHWLAESTSIAGDALASWVIEHLSREAEAV